MKKQAKKQARTKRGTPMEAKRKSVAAGVVAGKSLSQIAREHGVTPQNVSDVVHHPQTQDIIRKMLEPYHKRLEGIVASTVEAVERALKQDNPERLERLKQLSERGRLMRQVIEERAADADMQEIPGGKTGLMVRKIKKIGSGDDAELVYEYEVDAGLLKELRAHEEQARIELNDFTVNLKAVERACDLLELAQGGTRHDPAGSSGAAVSGDMGAILEIYARITRRGPSNT